MSRIVAFVRDNWMLLYFGLSVMLLIFASGVAVAQFQIFPYHILAGAWNAAHDWREHWRAYLRVRPDQMIEPARHHGDGVVVYLPKKAYAGVTFITGMWDGINGMKLVDLDGAHVHEWRVSFNEIWPQAPHLEEQPHDWDTLVHGAILYPNGDVLFNFGYEGLVKIDRCSNVIWKLPYRTHHSLDQDDEANIWAPGRKSVGTTLPNFPNISVPLYEDVIIKLSPNGKILQEISILDTISRSHHEGILFANGRETVQHTQEDGEDITHMNDIEVLDAALADRFALFDEGDIMVSIRNLNLIAVVDPETKTIKWSKVGPWLRQHDPDFLENGHISVFDNRRDDAAGAVFGGSRILEIDPLTQAVSTRYESGERNFFYTSELGKHQRLPSGNTLITEGQAGRAFEVTKDGELVWSYINRWDEDEVAWITEATRYPRHYAAFAEEGCQ